jgi:hypothetical protein
LQFGSNKFAPVDKHALYFIAERNKLPGTARLQTNRGRKLRRKFVTTTMETDTAFERMPSDLVPCRVTIIIIHQMRRV